ncbi:MAG TPA: DUF1328 domain-containing protein [Syntrophorhabdales bacterium]|nr:DUF1328 domain-containing protein [Syntrophorhabdales bacterium]
MLRWAFVFLIVAIIGVVFGFAGIAGAAVGIARVLFFVFLVLFFISLLTHVVRRPKGRSSPCEDEWSRRPDPS